MAIPRVIPVLLLRNKGLVKTVKFREQTYIGDPFNAVKIFNEKQVDEIIFLDIDCSREGREPPYEYLKQIASECFMPLAYGGGVSSIAQIRKLIQSGIEKVIINTNAITNPAFVREASITFGTSTIVGAMDIKKNFLGNYQVFAHTKRTLLNLDPAMYALQLQELGVGELFINNVNADGVMQGYDIRIIKHIADSLDIPTVACGGAGSVTDIERVILEANVSAAAGSLFVFHGKHKAVLITYPDPEILHSIFQKYLTGSQASALLHNK